jgi:hypothetical protein
MTEWTKNCFNCRGKGTVTGFFQTVTCDGGVNQGPCNCGVNLECAKVYVYESCNNCGTVYDELEEDNN